MIDYDTGDLFDSDAQVLVNTVNCKGVMGAGIALKFKTRYKANYLAYKRACDQQLIKPGDIFPFTCGGLFFPKYILNVATKDDWRNPSRLAWVEKAIVSMATWLSANDIALVAIPPLGCGLGGLRWEDVQPILERELRPLPNCLALLYEPAKST